MTSKQAADQSSEEPRDALSIFTKILLAFAAVSLFVGSFVI